MTSIAAQLVNVFVYGTLKRGQPNHTWMTDATAGAPATFVGPARLTRAYPLVIGTRYNIPFLLDHPDNGHRVLGEVYSVDAAKLAHMDVLEDYPEFYTRQMLDVELLGPNTSRTSCWVYMLQNFPGTMLSKPFIADYADSVELPYKEWSLREPGLKAKADLDWVNQCQP